MTHLPSGSQTPGKMEEEEEQRLGDEFFEPLKAWIVSHKELFSYMDELYEVRAPVGVSRLVMRGSDWHIR